MDIYTLGFTRKNAETFFGFLRSAGVATLLDVRLNNQSQLAGFAKKNDLKFFMRELCGGEYVHLPELAPTKALLNAYKKKEIPWESYEQQFNELLACRSIERIVTPELFENGCLLCSEHEPHHCHRRLVAEYINTHTDFTIKIRHLF